MSSLAALLQLTKLYCEKYQVQHVGSKTKLLVFTNKELEVKAKMEVATTTLSVDGQPITPVDKATHVGIVRSNDGNCHNLTERLSAHRRAVFGVLHSGLARGHRANPASSLRVECLYGLPVLLSGLASLVLTSKEEKMVGQHYKVHLERLLRLHQATPAPVVFLLASCLPLPALLHLRIF